MKPYIIGIDLGTGSTKAIAMNHNGDIIDTSQISYPTLQPKPNYQEQDPDLIWQAFVKCISTITSKQGHPDAICLSSAMHSVIPIDVNGNTLMNMMIWADNRSADHAREIRSSSLGQSIYEKGGTPIHAMTPLCKLAWLRENEPVIFANAKKFISIKEYVWFRLFDVYECDYAIGSATGLMDIGSFQWNDDALHLVSIESSQLSALVNTNHKRYCTNPELISELGITNKTSFIIGASDGCLANDGSFATREGHLALTIGTSGAVRVTQSRPVRNFKAMTFNYLLNDHTYVCGGPVNNGGIALKWYAENVLGRKLDTISDYSAMLKEIDEVPAGSEGLIFLPYVMGERAPIWDSHACGVFFGMRGHHRQKHFTRAVVEGISMALYDITSNMNLDIQQIRVSGGFVHSEAWLQIIADLFGKTVCLVNTADASAIGAAYLAMKELGIISDFLQLEPKEFKEFHPRSENSDSYKKLHSKYRNLYERVADLMVV